MAKIRIQKFYKNIYQVMKSFQECQKVTQIQIYIISIDYIFFDDMGTYDLPYDLYDDNLNLIH